MEKLLRKKGSNFQLLLFLGHLLLVTILILIFKAYIDVPLIGKERNLFCWDIEHYKFIMEKGYDKLRTAFFPGFPYFWKLFGGNPYVIIVVNILLFIGSFLAIKKYLTISNKEALILFSVPSFMFFGVAYSESLFLVFTSLYFYFVQKEKYLFSFLAILLACTVRSSTNILLPALIIAELFSEGKFSIKRFSSSLLGLLIGLAISFTIHYLSVEEWFTFFDSQKEWGHVLAKPKLPFGTWESCFDGAAVDGLISRALMLDSVSFMVGLFSLFGLAYFSFNKLLNKKPQADYLTMLSLACLTGYFFFILLFQEGSLHSLNRYIFCSVFFIQAFITLRQYKIHPYLWLVFFNFMLVIYSVFSDNVNYHNVVAYIIFGLFVIYLFNGLNFKNKILNNTLFFIFYLTFTGFQAWFWLRFTGGMWVG